MELIMKIAKVETMEKWSDPVSNEVIEEQLMGDASYTLVEMSPDGKWSGGYKFFDTQDEARKYMEEILADRENNEKKGDK